jgi:hypothetical protein
MQEGHILYTDKAARAKQAVKVAHQKSLDTNLKY